MPSDAVFICCGETDEFHPFCPFATRSITEAADHGHIRGHWCIETHPSNMSSLHREVLDREAKEHAA